MQSDSDSTIDPAGSRRSVPTVVIVGLVMSSVGIVIAPLSLPGLIVSIIGLVKVHRSRSEGRALAWAGIACGLVGLVELVLYAQLISMYVDVFNQMTPVE